MTTPSHAPTPCAIHFVVTDFNAPLFDLQDLGSEATSSSSLVCAQCQTHFPQFHKRGLGWRLSVEEVYYLLWLAQNTDRTAQVTVAFTTATIEQTYHTLAARHRLACTAYVHLTHARHLRLRHAGSLYGALFIGYGADTDQHGEYLFFAGPLEPLAATRASRVAKSVGKRACEVWLDHAEAGAHPALCTRDLPTRSLSSSTVPKPPNTATVDPEAPKIKRRRQD